MTSKISYWDAVAGVQRERGTTPEEEAEIAIRKLPKDPEIIKAEIWWQIKAFRAVQLDSGFLCNGHWYHSDIASKNEFNTLKLKALERRIDAGDMTANIVIDGTNTKVKTIDNGYMEVSYNDVLAIVAAGEIQTKRIYERAATHQNFLNLSANPEAYDWSTGWPPIYEP